MAKIMANVWVLAIEFTGDLINEIATFRDGQRDHADLNPYQTIPGPFADAQSSSRQRVPDQPARCGSTTVYRQFCEQCIPHEVIRVKQSHPHPNQQRCHQQTNRPDKRPDALVKSADAHMHDARFQGGSIISRYGNGSAELIYSCIGEAWQGARTLEMLGHEMSSAKTTQSFEFHHCRRKLKDVFHEFAAPACIRSLSSLRNVCRLGERD